MEFLSVLRRILSLDTVIYIAIVLVFLAAMARCVFPMARLCGRLRRATRTIIVENKQNKEKKSWHDLHFFGDRLQATWADFLQNAELREAHGESCDVSQYINEETLIYDGAVSTRLAEITPGLLTSLGILGTFLGIVMGLTGLSISEADTSVLLSAMDQLIGGMSTAFLTSIAGVIASLIFQVLYNHYTEKCQKAITRFCEVFGLYAMPKPVSEDTAMLTLQQEQTAYIRQAVSDMSQKMAVQMEQSIMRAMLPVQRSMDNFILAATQAQVEGVDRIAQVFVQRMNVALGQEFEHLRSVLRETGNEQLKSQQEMRSAVEAIGQMTQDVVNMHQLSQGVLEHFRDYVRDMDASRASVDETNERTIGLLEAMNKTSGQQAMYLAKLQEYQAALTANSQQYSALTDQFLKSAQEQTHITSREMERVVEQMHDGAQALGDSAQAFAAKTHESLARTTAMFDESLNTSLREIDKTLAAMNDAAQRMPQMLSQSRERYSDQVDQFVTALVRLQKAMDKLSAQIEGAGKE